MQNMSASQEDFWNRQEQIYKRAYITIALLIINVLTFLASTLIFGEIYEKGVLATESVLAEGEYYRLFTAIFLHADIGHLANNMILLLLVGAIVENYTGHIFYLFLYLLSGLFGNMLSIAYEINNNLRRVSLGASGAIMGLVGFIVVWILVNRKGFLRSRNVFIRLILLGVFIVQASFFQRGANTAAHFGGLITGAVLAVVNIVLLKNNRKMEGLA